ncbi:hypothetical protein F511_36323 [Dorcoceras hygrometricum]|uniref:Uncharacterized protein n=1 Tax=Dorcoceras hygrometricum TaxID=472368 RepID=A0A2Z7B3Z1_9LAMI|nr:hypothetical protein F511_36323 [Dorcoceras hygrometricum]
MNCLLPCSMIKRALDHCSCIRLRTQSLLLYTALDMRLSYFVLEHSALQLCTSVVAPISVVPAERPHAQRRNAPKRKLRMTAGSDDEIVEEEPAVENVVMKQKETTSVDDVDNIIEEVIAATAQLEIDVVDPDVSEGIAMETDLAEPVVARSDDITVEISKRLTAVTDEESMSIEDLLQQIPVHEFKQGVQAQSGIFSTDLANIRKEVRDISKEFDDKLAVIRNDLLEFRVETQEQYATLRANLAELMAFVTRGRDDKKGEVDSSHGRGQPPPEDKSKPGSGDGGSSGSRSEPSRKRGSSGSKQRDCRYWING